jgi:hypothetical protein
MTPSARDRLAAYLLVRVATLRRRDLRPVDAAHAREQAQILGDLAAFVHGPPASDERLLLLGTLAVRDAFVTTLAHIVTCCKSYIDRAAPRPLLCRPPTPGAPRARCGRFGGCSHGRGRGSCLNPASATAIRRLRGQCSDDLEVHHLRARLRTILRARSPRLLLVGVHGGPYVLPEILLTTSRECTLRFFRRKFADANSHVSHSSSPHPPRSFAERVGRQRCCAPVCLGPRRPRRVASRPRYARWWATRRRPARPG